jgi:hypothetical protein
MPLADRRRLDASTRNLPAIPVVVIQAEVALESVRADDVVPSLSEAKRDAAGRILASHDGFELHGHIDVCERAGRRHDDVERVLDRPLYEHPPAARRARDLLDRPLPLDDGPAIEPVRLEVKPLDGNGLWQRQLRGRGRAGARADRRCAERGEDRPQEPTSSFGTPYDSYIEPLRQRRFRARRMLSPRRARPVGAWTTRDARSSRRVSARACAGFTTRSRSRSPFPHPAYRPGALAAPTSRSSGSRATIASRAAR